jgi:multiple sugar transport system substrate-binding protein
MNSSMRPYSRRDFLKLAGTSSAAALAAAYGLPLRSAMAQGNTPPGDTTAKLTIFNFGGEAQQGMYTDAIARFNTRYPNVTVEDIYTPFPEGWGQFITLLQLRIASGEPVDIVAMAIEGAQETIAQGILRPMDDVIAADAQLQQLVADVEPVLHNALKGPDGSTYYFTREWNNMIIHYNPAMFEAAGLDMPSADWTWDDFLAAAQALTSGEGADKVFGFAIPYFNFGLTPWWHTNGTATLTADWLDSNLNDPKMLESVRFVHSLVHEHGVSPAVEGTDPYQLMLSGKAAMTGAGRWPFATYIANDFRTVDITPWPRKETGTTVFGSGGWSVTQASQNVELAVELIKDLTSVEVDLAAIDGGTSLPARRSVTVDNETYNAFPANAHYFFESLEDIKPVPSPANFAEVESIFMRNLGLIMSNQVTPEQGLEAAHVELSEAMANMRERLGL